jgi:hypothetical protein
MARVCGRALAIAAVPLADAWAVRALRLWTRDFAALTTHARRLEKHLRDSGVHYFVQKPLA